MIDHQAYNFILEVNQTVHKLIEAMSARWPNSCWSEDTKANASMPKGQAFDVIMRKSAKWLVNQYGDLKRR